MKKILFIAMLIIASTQGYAQSLTVINNIVGSALQFKVRGQNLPAACNTSLSALIPLAGSTSWFFGTPTTPPLVMVPPVVLPFAYDAVYFEVLSGGVVICSGNVGKQACGWVPTVPIPCIPGVHTAAWTNVGPNVTVTFN